MAVYRDGSVTPFASSLFNPDKQRPAQYLTINKQMFAELN